MAYLSSPHGQEVQERAYEEIIKAHPENPWDDCLYEEKSEFMVSFVKVHLPTLTFASKLTHLDQ